MSSIRPLITITILVVVGAYLYVKINEGPVKPAASAGDAWQDPSSDAVPPLDATTVAPGASGGAAATWPSAPTTAPATTVDVSATPPAAPSPIASGTTGTTSPANDAADKLPAVPQIPEMPEIPLTADAAAPAQTPVALPTELPANIPTARYPDDSTLNGSTAAQSLPSATPLSAAADPAGAASPFVQSVTQPEVALAAAQSLTSATNAIADAATAVATSPAVPDVTNPLRQPAPQPAAPADRYAIGNTTPNQIAADVAVTPVATSFAASWPAIQAALDRGELASAHQMLSPWHNEPTLTPAESEKVETLLGQLAGTVVYSTEHQLGPARVVRPGETLETIAKECNVPWQLLAKINGIPAADQLRPGQELKVVRGPFSAVVDLRRNELSLAVDGRYAGKFPVTVTPGQSIADGEWVVGKKANARAPGHAILLQGNPVAPSTPQPTLVIASESVAINSADGAVIKISPQDAAELTDILSIGSRVVTRR